ncbi:MAG: VWA domain-containing protein [Beijerinckiaceae bacterium]|nr:VWA domain-containing protein [Beijerinckiaceae bacterium]MCZ8301904.1 VWA domain-containing protein [Beijerinckiaceae bacterium]
MTLAVAPVPAGGHLAENVAFFGRALRQAGMAVGPGAMLDAVAAIEVIGIGHRDEFRAALEAVFVKRRQDADLFDQAFRLFWRRRALLEKMMATMMPVAPGDPDPKREEALRRLTEALFQPKPPEDQPERERVDLDSRLTVSDIEVFRSRDFDGMSALELAEAKREVARLVMPLQRVKTRRFLADPHGNRPDPRRAMRASLRAGGDAFELRFRARAEKVPPLVALCDISGSMSQYSRIFLHFLHAVAQTGRRVSAFTFATELTNVSHALKSTKDPDLALRGAAKMVRDWDGGTRIGQTLERFNKRWARRVMSGGAVVLLITDGLERDLRPDLARELARLRRTARRLIWLNPLLRFDGFEARAAGIRAMLPHVDEFRTCHSLNAMADLCRALADGQDTGADPRRYLREEP